MRSLTRAITGRSRTLEPSGQDKICLFFARVSFDPAQYFQPDTRVTLLADASVIYFPSLDPTRIKNCAVVKGNGLEQRSTLEIKCLVYDYPLFHCIFLSTFNATGPLVGARGPGQTEFEIFLTMIEKVGQVGTV